MSDWILSFSERVQYPENNQGITFEIFLSCNRETSLPIDVKLDTGSTFCVFQRAYADALGLNLEVGTPQRIRTATGSFMAYGHEVTLTVGQLEWDAVVFSAADENFPVNVVGRLGFLNRLRIGLVEYEQWLYFNAYDGV